PRRCGSGDQAVTFPRAILGTKLGMTQVFDEQSRAIPVTVVKAGPVKVTQVKTVATDGYNAIQIAYGDVKKVNKPAEGHFAAAGAEPARHLIEIRVDDPAQYEVGQEITVAEVFEQGVRSEEHTSELQSRENLVCRLLLEKKNA